MDAMVDGYGRASVPCTMSSLPATTSRAIWTNPTITVIKGTAEEVPAAHVVQVRTWGWATHSQTPPEQRRPGAVRHFCGGCGSLTCTVAVGAQAERWDEAVIQETPEEDELPPTHPDIARYFPQSPQPVISPRGGSGVLAFFRGKYV